MRARPKAIAAAVGVAAMLAAPTAQAGYTTGTPLSTGKLTSAVAVNQTNGDVYVASGGGTSTGAVEEGSLKRFSSAGAGQACAPTPNPARPASVAINPVSGGVDVLNVTSPVAPPLTGKLTFFAGPCGAQEGSAVEAGVTSKAKWPQIATDASGNVYVPNSFQGAVRKYSSAGSAIALAHPIEGLTQPTAAAIDAAGHIYVVEPKSAGVNEKQKITFSGSPTGGTFVLGNLPAACSAGSTAPIEYTTTTTMLRTNIQNALGEKCGGSSNFAVGTALGVTFQNEYGKQNQPLMSCNGSSLTPGGAGCAVETEEAGGSPEEGRLSEFAADGASLGVLLEGEVSSVAIDKSTGNLFVGRGNYDGTFESREAFHIQKYSSSLVKLADFGAGLFGLPGSGSGLAYNQIAVEEASGKVYAADPGHASVQVFNYTAPALFTLSVSKTGSGTGTVTSSPAGINCGSECSAEYESGTEVTLSASEDPGSLFTGWSGACSGSGECKVTMSEAKSVSANFAPAFALTLTKEGGEGTVVSNPAGINCGGACSASFESGKALVLTASPAAGYLFVSWKGCDTGGANGRQCTVTMSKAKAVVAKFIPSYTIAVSKEGPGLGKVQSSPGGLLCLNNCSATSAEFKAGASVALSAVAAKHFHLVKWTGDCSGNGACSFPAIAASHTVGAEFAEDQQFSLTVNKEGGGNGTVKSSLAGISCGATCPTMSASYYTGVEVELTATPGKGSALKEWTGACTGSGACKVTMSEAKTVGAKFE